MTVKPYWPGRFVLDWRKKTMKRLVPLFIVAVGLFTIASNAQAGKKTYVCHKDGSGAYKTLKISKNAVDAHRKHGDRLGKCENLPTPQTTEQGVIIFRCGSDEFGEALVVTAVSASDNVPQNVQDVAGEDCAEANASLLNGGFELNQVNSGAGMDLDTEYFYTGKVRVR